MNLIYCYDAYCGWCYGFSPIIKKISEEYQSIFHTEVLSGGMILPEQPTHIGTMAAYILEAYKTVEDYTNIKFGKDYLWHIENPDLSDWFPNSEKPAIALCIFKEIFPDKQTAFASDLQYALHFEGRDLTDNAAYDLILDKYGIDKQSFYEKLQSAIYKDKAKHEFAMCKQLKVTGYPCVLLQVDESKFYLLSRGFSTYDDVKARIVNVLKEIGNQKIN